MLATNPLHGLENDIHNTPEKLATQMALLAHDIRSLVIVAFESGTASNTMRNLYEEFKCELLPDLAVNHFADMYAQTLAYGLFVARHNHNASIAFQRQDALEHLPVTSSLLRSLFATITGSRIENEPFDYLVDQLIDLLKAASIDSLSGASGQHSQQHSLIHFYETFLAQYNPDLRGQRGVYYTPQPVVSYIVRSVDYLLRTHFKRRDGLTGTFPMLDEPRVLLLDPACGTGTFLSTVIDHVREFYRQKSNPDMWLKYVRDCLLPGICGYELLMAPYAIAHLELSKQLAALDLPETERDAWAYHFENGEGLNIYLANALEEAVYEPFMSPTGHEVFTKPPIMVVFGNPPFAGHSANKGAWIASLLDAYKDGCPELKKPAQAKWLSDDYVKFIRLAQWYVEQIGHGIVAFVTNHSYLDNPTFRGMRRSLAQAFDDIYILDLHGNNKKKERTPDGSKDENVFAIQQGIAIGIFVKWRDAQTRSSARVHHADLWGLREVYKSDAGGQPVLVGGKYAWLLGHDLASTNWTTLDLQTGQGDHKGRPYHTTKDPLYLFVPQDTRYLAEYEAGWSIPTIFQVPEDPAPGIITCHDDFAISWSRAEAMQKVERLLATENEIEARQLFRLCSQDQWQYAAAKKDLRQDDWQQDLVEILYRPFDKRWTVFNRHVAVHRRERVMRHILAGENIGLTIGRAGQVINQAQWDIVFCTRNITEFNLFRRGGNYLFPLYLYSRSGERAANLTLPFISELTSCLAMTWLPDGRGDLMQTFGPEDVFAYLYAVLHSFTYRERYAQFLKRDFPRVPLTSNADLFRILCHLGSRLLSLHLLEQPVSPIATYSFEGNNIVETVRYDKDRSNETDSSGRIWINTTQYFAGIPSETWAFSVGGYQVCQKWLKDRRGRKLTDDELTHYLHILAALTETTFLIREIDEIIEEQGGFPLLAGSTTLPI